MKGWSYDFDGAEGEVEIFQGPEFLSDADRNNNPNDPIPINADRYNLPFQYGKPQDDAVVIDSLAVAKNRPVVYSIVAGNAADLYEIDPATGKITFTGTPDLTYTGGTLQVKVADAAHPDLYDLASVTFTFGWAEFVMCVDQPVPNERKVIDDTWSTVGHTFWHIKASTGLINSAVVATDLDDFLNHSWGFYPSKTLGPGSFAVVSTCPGTLKNDDAHVTDVDVYKIYDIPALDDLLAVLQFTKSTKESPGTYDLSTRNCTTITIAAADAAGVTVPKTTQEVEFSALWFYYKFNGYNAGDMGEDLMLEGGVRGQYGSP